MTRDRRAVATILSLLALILFAPPMGALGTQRRLAQFGKQTWRSDSGLPQNTVHSVLQTQDGFLWIATEAGLVRFDGLSFRLYNTENTVQLHSDIISTLKQDSSGALWISTTGGLLRRSREGVFTSFTVSDGLPSNSVSAMIAPHSGGVLAMTAAGLAYLRGDRFEKVAGTDDVQVMEGGSNFAEDESERIWIAGGRNIFNLDAHGSIAATIPIDQEIGEVRALAVVNADEVCIGGRNGVEVFQKSERLRLTIRDGLPSNDVQTMLADGTGGLWVGTSRGLAHWSGGRMTVVEASVGFAGAFIERLYRDREGALWVATNRGIARVVDGHAELVTRRSRLTGVLSIFEDREGSVWFGTDNAGLTVMREQAFSTVTEQDGLTAGPVRALFQDSAGTIWIGTNGGGLDRIDGGEVSAVATHPALSSEVILSLAQTGADLWVGTPNGLNRVRNGRVRVFTTQDGLADDFVRSLYADRDGSLWIGTRNGLSHLVNGAFTSYSRMDGLGSDLIGTMLRSRAGDLWIGTLGGLSRLSGNGFSNFTTKDGMGSDAVTSLLEDGAGTLWIGTQDGGLSRGRQGKFTALPPTRTGVPQTVFGMLEDATGDLWLSSRRGIYRVSTSALNAFATKGKGEITARVFGVADGMRMSEGSSGGHPAAWRMGDGSLWFATLDGAAFVNPGLIARNGVPPQTAIEQILLQDRPVDMTQMTPGQTLALPAGERRMEVQYAGLSFVAPQKVRYRYKLDGFDKEWVEAGSRREAFYTNLPPGRYRFLVVSSNNDGVWSAEPTGFDLRVRPTLLQTRWFYRLLILGLGALGFVVYRWRVVSVEAQYKAVLGERGRIAREIHDTLAQGYVAISVQLEVTARLLQTSTDAALKQLEETKELVRGSLAEARSSIWNLRAQGEAETLPSLLAAVTESRSGVGGPALRLEVKGTYRPVSSRVEKEILRVTQEAVTNAVRHAGAGHIVVVLRYDASTVRLEVIDDGKGFAESSRDLSGSGHFGLQGMRERAARIGATLKIESVPGKGTRIDLQINPRKAEREDRL